ncbi:hypothetical protein [Lysobacter fragariae]
MTGADPYRALDRRTFETIAYNAVGRASEIGTYPAYYLAHSKGNSGWSVGAVQWDFGQPGRGGRVDDLLLGYQAWAAQGERFNDRELASLTGRLRTPGQTGNALSSGELSRLNAFLRSDPGRAFVDGLSAEQIERKWENVGLPLSQTPWLQQLDSRDPAQAAEIVTMATKLFNQNENKGGQLVAHLQDNELTADQVSEWIGGRGVDKLSAIAKEAILSGRDNARLGIGVMNALELGDGRLSRAWRREIHGNGNVSLTHGFNSEPDVQLLDGMMRNPIAGARIRAHVDEGAASPAVVIQGVNSDARREMARVELGRAGDVSIRSPDGNAWDMTPSGWDRNRGVALPPSSRERDMPDHSTPLHMPSLTRTNADGSQQFPTEHRDFHLHVAIRSCLPSGLSEAHVAHLTACAREGGITSASKLDTVSVEDDQAFVIGKIPGYWVKVDLTAPPPPMQQTLARLESFESPRISGAEEQRAQTRSLEPLRPRI